MEENFNVPVLIGGGKIVNGGTLEIDRYIVESCKRERPHQLFIPTASGEPEGYIATIQREKEDQFRRFLESNRMSFLAIENNCAISIQKDS